MQDILAALDEHRSSKASKVVDSQQKAERSIEPVTPAASGAGGGPQAATAAAAAAAAATTDDGRDQQTSGAGAAAYAVASTPPQFIANSARMTKPDLKDFIMVQANAIASVLAINHGRTTEPVRKHYKWPTKSLGLQVGASLTKLTDIEGWKACSSNYRLGTKAKNT